MKEGKKERWHEGGKTFTKIWVTDTNAHSSVGQIYVKDL